MKNRDLDQALMREALRLAGSAARRGEVPVGAILTDHGKVIARSANATLRRKDPTAHAEVLVIRKAARLLRNHRLEGLTLYVTLEPCLMCLGAMVQARIARCVFAASDPKVGAASTLALPRVQKGVNHRFPVEGGCLGDDASKLLREFFKSRRRKSPAAG
ncbi:MAG: tRNA adenosine(34) deaminase TadA [Acidobacteria bacterium]|nr:tRNA adenosine(34) deaminase TadA [Acidobacteriota bacterium]